MTVSGQAAREGDDFCGYPFAGHCEAIDEIERLRAALASLASRAEQAEKALRAGEHWLAVLYAEGGTHERVLVAQLCDRALDRSGAMLGRIRDAALSSASGTAPAEGKK